MRAGAAKVSYGFSESSFERKYSAYRTWAGPGSYALEFPEGFACLNNKEFPAAGDGPALPRSGVAAMKLSHLLGVLTIMLTTQAARGANPVVVLETSMGTIKIELYVEKAPVTVKNFLNYVEKKHYDGLVFHRVIENFMIQGGGFDKDLKERKTERAIKNESDNGLKNERGTLAMARTNIPDSATSQFFINVKNNDFLDRANARDKVGYCVFGRVIDGMDVVDKIRKVKTGAKGQFEEDCPAEDVIIKSARKAETPK
jgi:cyclophilin family peptidyl-prolyl cis-trans isomerase